MRRTAVIMLAVALLPPGLACADFNVVVLNGTDNARTERVTGGVPFAEGEFPGGLQVVDSAGRSVPTQWETLAAWADGSPKWVLVDFVAEVDGAQLNGKSTVYTVKPGGKPAGAAVAVPQWLADCGVRLRLVDDEGRAIKAALTGQWQALTSGPVRSLYRQRGKLGDGDLEYEVYLTVDAAGDDVDMRRADMQILLENNGCHDQFGGRKPVESVEHFKSFELVFNGGGAAATTELSQNHRMPGVVAGKVRGKDLTACVRWGWQNHPITLISGPDATRIVLLPEGRHTAYMGQYGSRKDMQKGTQVKTGEDLKSWDFYRWPGGFRKEWQITLRTGAPGAAVLAANWEKPLTFVLEDRSLYRTTNVFGPRFVEARDWPDQARRRFERIQRVKWDDGAADPLHGERIGLPRFRQRGGTYPVPPEKRNPFYGWMDFGDLAWGDGYASLHYDWTGSMYFHFLRTGQYGFFDQGQIMVSHHRTIDHVWGASKDHRFAGLSRYEKGAWHGNYYLPNVSHTWIRGDILDWLLTGNPVSRAAAQEYVEYFYHGHRRWEKYSGNYGIRIPGWTLQNLAFAYMFFGEKEIAAKARECAEGVLWCESTIWNKGGYILNRAGGRNQEQVWMHGILMTGIGDYILATGDTKYLPLHKRMADFYAERVFTDAKLQGNVYTPSQPGAFFGTDGLVKHDSYVNGGFVGEMMGQAALLHGNKRYAEIGTRAFHDVILWHQKPPATVTTDADGRFAESDLSPIGIRMMAYPNAESKIHGKLSLLGGYVLWAMDQTGDEIPVWPVKDTASEVK